MVSPDQVPFAVSPIPEDPSVVICVKMSQLPQICEHGTAAGAGIPNPAALDINTK
jgi:hypothetical protein